jgi:hypothetical protein
MAAQSPDPVEMDRDGTAAPPSGWRAAGMTLVFLLSVLVVAATALMTIMAFYVDGFAEVPLWVGLGPIALGCGTYAAIWLARA